MSERRLSLNLILEPLLILVFALIFIIIKVYHAIPMSSQYYITATISLQALIGIIIIYSVSILLGIYGKYTANEKEMQETAHIFKLVSYPILILILLHTLDISVASLLIGAGFLGIVVGLAAQTALGNVFASLSLVYSRPFVKGEKITIVPTSYGIQAPTYPHEAMMNEITGTVRNIGLIYTRILRDDMSMLYIPNSSLNQGLIINHSRANEKQIRVRLEAARGTEIDAFKQRLVSKLSKDGEDFYKLKELEIRMSLISTGETYGITVTSRVKVLEYDRLSQWLSENAVKALFEVEKKGGRKR